MITRIVKMNFREDKVSEFIQLFKDTVPFIKQFEGCQSVILVHDVKNSNILFTISEWTSEENLNIYRESKFFLETWKKTKALFLDKATAWSLLKIA